MNRLTWRHDSLYAFVLEQIPFLTSAVLASAPLSPLG